MGNPTVSSPTFPASSLVGREVVFLSNFMCLSQDIVLGVLA